MAHINNGESRVGGDSSFGWHYANIIRLMKLLRYKHAVAKGYDAAAPHYDAWKWQILWRKIEWPVLRSLLTPPERVVAPERVLEIGIGTGAVAERILDEVRSIRRYVGIDLSARMLAVCAQRLGDRVELIHEDVAKVDFSSLGDTFDFVLSCRMIGHLQSPGDLFTRVQTVLAQDGRFVVTDLDPGHAYASTRLPTSEGRVEVPTFKHRQEDVIAAAEKAGLRLDRLYRTYEDEALANAGAEVPDSLVGRKGPLFNLFVFKQGPSSPA
ncbi:class I SAM-dependent methyltransferase [Mesorhizobium sp. M0590]|uniref:class I SAM-dependent DNA methyltransferase n=1 Tax=unclassified Mesorhizobium TaxID=325217 RepID=UPI00333C2338